MIPLDQREFLKELGGLIWRPRFEGVFQLDGWDFVTNGHALLRVRGESPAAPGAPREMPPIAQVLAQPRPNVRSTTMEPLCAWAQLGGFYRYHCAYCESPSDHWETNRVEFVDGIEINRCLLWHYLKPLPRSGALRVSWGDPTHAVLVEHVDWEIYLMPVGDPDPKYTRPFEFEEPTP